MKNTKVGIIGLGRVGSHVALALVQRAICDEIVLVDMNKEKSNSECQDLLDSLLFLSRNVDISLGDFKDLGDCDVIVNCIGNVSIIKSNNRSEEKGFTIAGVDGYIDTIRESGFDGVFINITNPCDVVTEFISKRLGLPRGRVFGTGTAIDTARLRKVISNKIDVDSKSINAYMIGEHGDHQFAPWSTVNVGGEPIDSLVSREGIKDFDKADITEQAVKGGWVVFNGKGCTEFGIGTSAAYLADLVLRDEKTVVSVSCELAGEYGEKDVFAGVPAVIGRNGVEKVIELSLTSEEKEKFHNCCENIRKNRA